jgi:hypothetical protein
MAGEFGRGHDDGVMHDPVVAACFRLKDFPNIVQSVPAGEDKRNKGDPVRQASSLDITGLALLHI